MSLLGTFGRICYSAYFVVDGYRLATQPETYTGRMALGVGQVLPLVQDHLPPDVADRLPEDEESWVRILGITQVIAGVSLAAGFARRPSALLLALATIPRLVESAD